MRRIALLLTLLACDDGAADPVPELGVDVGVADASTADVVVDAEVDAAPDAGVDSAVETTVFDVWAAYRERLRQSPDHRQARAEALVQAGDPAELFAFVRDEIGAIPPHPVVGFPAAQALAYAGPWGTLRGGRGTPRDKAELLRSLLERAGHAAEVVHARPDEMHRDLETLFRAPVSASFAPPVNADDRAAWNSVFAPDSIAREWAVVDADGAHAAAIAERLAGYPRPEVQAVLPQLPERLPLVEAVVDGESVVFNPHWPGAQPGDSFSDGSLSAAGPPVYAVTTVRVWARGGRDADPERGETLAEGTWSDRDLVGRRLVWRARPVLDLPELLDTRVDQIPLYLASLAVEGGDLDDETRAELSVAGQAFTASGWRMTTRDGAVQVNGNPIAAGLDDDPARQATVARLSVEADGSAFPDVRLRVGAFDDAGDVVRDLTAQSFAVADDDVPVAATLTRNRRVPRLLLLLDNSGSVPAEFQAERRVELGLAIADQVLTVPEAEMVVMFVGQSPGAWAPWTRVRDALAAQLEVRGGGGSPLWDSLVAAVRRAPTLVVMITDGQNFGDGLSESRARLLADSDVPALVLGVGDQDPETLQAMADATGGTYRPVEAHEQVLDAIDTLLRRPDTTPYTLRYRAPLDGRATRTARVTLRDPREIAAAGEYEVPAVQTDVRGMFGLYISVTRGRRTVTRTLAGLPHNVDAEQATPGHAHAVRDALLGSTTLLAELGPPSWSMVLEEVLAARLSLRAASDARDNPDAFWDVLRDGVETATLEPYRLLLDPPSTAATPLGPRFVLYSVQPTTRAPETSLRRFDILPFTRYAGLAQDPQLAYAQALRRSAHDAAMEAGFFPDSTEARLDDRALIQLPAEDVARHFFGTPNADAWAAAIDADAYGDDWQALVPEAGEPVAFWVIHEATGSAIAGIPGGGAGEAPGGGGSAQDAVRLGEILAQLHSLTGLGGGFWLELEVAKAKIVAYSTIAILNLRGWNTDDPNNPADTPEAVVEDFICGQLEGLVTERLPPALQEILSAYGEFSGASGAPEATLCD